MNIFKYGYLPLTYWKNWFGNVKQFFRNLKYAYQRATKGYCDVDVWGLSDHLAELISNMVKDLANNHCGHPTGSSDEEWTKTLNEIHEHFKSGIENDDSSYGVKISEAYDKAQAHILNIKSIYHSESKTYSVKYEYDDEEAYNKDCNIWLELEQEYYDYRSNEICEGLDLLKENWNSLWD